MAPFFVVPCNFLQTETETISTTLHYHSSTPPPDEWIQGVPGYQPFLASPLSHSTLIHPQPTKIKQNHSSHNQWSRQLRRPSLLVGFHQRWMRVYVGPIQTHNHPKMRSINRPLEKFCMFETNKILVGKLRVLVKMGKSIVPVDSIKWTTRPFSINSTTTHPSISPARLSILSSIIMRVT